MIDLNAKFSPAKNPNKRWAAGGMRDVIYAEANNALERLRDTKYTPASDRLLSDFFVYNGGPTPVNKLYHTSSGSYGTAGGSSYYTSSTNSTDYTGYDHYVGTSSTDESMV